MKILRALLENEKLHRDASYTIFLMTEEWKGLPKYLPLALDCEVSYHYKNQASDLIYNSEKIWEICGNWDLNYDALRIDGCVDDDGDRDDKENRVAVVPDWGRWKIGVNLSLS